MPKVPKMPEFPSKIVFPPKIAFNNLENNISFNKNYIEIRHAFRTYEATNRHNVVKPKTLYVHKLVR